MTPETIAVPAIDSLPFAVALRENPALIGAVRSVHLTGIAVLVGSVLAFDLRVLGVGRAVAVDALARLLLPLAVAALVLVLPTGVMMFAAYASELLTDRVFALKMLLIFVSGLNAIAFHSGPYRTVGSWRVDAPAPTLARLLAAVSIAAWVAVIACAGQLRAS